MTQLHRAPIAVTNQTNDFIHDLRWQDLPTEVQNMSRLCLLDLLGVAASGTRTDLSSMIGQHALQHFGTGVSTQRARLLFDGRACSPLGAALANGMTIDSIDAHDGYKPAKGHAGCGVLAALLAVLDGEYDQLEHTEQELLTCLVIGYELACRAGVALHDSTPDYHTSGAWVALAAAALGSRVLRLTSEQTRHALGIAEYHGPRSQMMRCIDHPTMLKDGSGWGAMAGVSSAYLAQSGFTGAPALTIESECQWYADLGNRWLICEQYFKPYPVCRWAQPAVVAALYLRQKNSFQIQDVQSLVIGTFHESRRLSTARPTTTEEAQYSLPFPVAAALANNRLTVDEITGKGLKVDTVLGLSQAIELKEVQRYNDAFPQRRFSDVTITLKDGRVLESGPTEADGDPESPLPIEDIHAKFHTLASPVIGKSASQAVASCVSDFGYENRTLDNFFSLIYTPASDT